MPAIVSRCQSYESDLAREGQAMAQGARVHYGIQRWPAWSVRWVLLIQTILRPACQFDSKHPVVLVSWSAVAKAAPPELWTAK